MLSTFNAPSRQRFVLGWGVAVLLGIILFSIVVVVALRRDAIEGVQRESGRLGIVLAEQTTRALQAADIELADMASAIASRHVSSPADLQREFGSKAGFDELQARLINLPQVEAFVIIDTMGQVVNSTRSWPPKPVNVADREYFRLQQASSVNALEISTPVESRASGSLTFYMTRRISAPDGSFLGVMTASMRIDYFKEIYRALGFGQGSSITFARRDGIILIRYPQGSSVIGQKLPSSRLFYKAVAEGGGFYQGPAQFDGPGTNLVSVHVLRAYPLVIDIVTAERMALTKWRQQAIQLAIGVLCIFGTLVALLFAFNRQFVMTENAQASLAEQSHKMATQAKVLQSTLDNMSQGLFVADPTGRIVVYNNRVLELLDLPAEMMQKMPYFSEIWRYQHKNGEFDHLPAAERATFNPSSSLPFAQLYERERPDGTILEVRSTALPDGGVVRTFTDITQVRRQAMQMREAQRLESIGRLAGGIAHDFNNLLAAISLSAEMLAEDLTSHSEQHEHAKVILTAAKAGGGLTHRLLAYSRRQTLTPQALDLARYLPDQIELIRRTIGDNVSLYTDIEPDLPAIEVDPSQVGDALLNVAVNARDAMPKGGMLSISAHRAKPSSEHEGDFVVLAVTDTGMGMSPETLAQATDPFFTTKPFGEGTGLGLSMVDGFVKQSGGYLSIESEPGHGTTIAMWLPCALGEAVALPEPSTQPPSGHERLLVVDDNEAVRNTLRSVLASLGYDVSEASSGPEAMQHLRTSGPFSLLLTDVAMPDGMSGTDLAEQARYLCPAMPALLMSGFPDAGGPNTIAPRLQFLRKPFTRQELADAIRTALDNAKVES